MNLTKTRQLSAELLKLLKQVYEQNGASNLEKDLLKENLRELYKAIDETEVEEKNSNGYHKEEEKPQAQEPENKDSKASPEAIQELVQEIRAEAIRTVEQPISSSFTFLDEEPEEIEEELEAETEEQMPEPEIKKEVYKAPEPVLPQEEKEIPTVQEFHSEPIPQPTPVQVQRVPETQPVYQQAAPEPVKAHYYISSETEELFTTRVAKELSDKLNQSHLPDLHKAFGLNDKLLTISELFGGDSASFKETMDTLNSYSHFDQAKRYLAENVVDKYRWTLPAKKDSARQLIQLIRRKYL